MSARRQGKSEAIVTGLERLITSYLESRGCRVRFSRGRQLRGTTQKGDFFIVKLGKPTPDQEKAYSVARQWGGMVVIAYSIEDVVRAGL